MYTMYTIDLPMPTNYELTAASAPKLHSNIALKPKGAR